MIDSGAADWLQMLAMSRLRNQLPLANRHSHFWSFDIGIEDMLCWIVGSALLEGAYIEMEQDRLGNTVTEVVDDNVEG